MNGAQFRASSGSAAAGGEADEPPPARIVRIRSSARSGWTGNPFLIGFTPCKAVARWLFPTPGGPRNKTFSARPGELAGRQAVLHLRPVRPGGKSAGNSSGESPAAARCHPQPHPKPALLLRHPYPSLPYSTEPAPGTASASDPPFRLASTLPQLRNCSAVSNSGQFPAALRHQVQIHPTRPHPSNSTKRSYSDNGRRPTDPAPPAR